MSKQPKSTSLISPEILQEAIIESFRKLTPRQQWQNPVMFVVYLGSILTTVLWGQAVMGQGEAPAGFILAITLWLWFTVLFTNFAEAVAEGRSKAQAAFLRSAKRDIAATELNMFIGKNFLVTYHRDPMRSVTATIERVQKNAPLVARAPDRLTYHLLDALFEQYEPGLQSLALDIEQLE